MRFLSLLFFAASLVAGEVIASTNTSTSTLTASLTTHTPSILPTAPPSPLSACSQADNRVLLFKESAPNSYKLVFENLNQNARPNWIDFHVETTATGARTVRVISNGMTSNTCEQSGLLLKVGDSLIQHVSYGDAANTTICATTPMMYTRENDTIESEFHTSVDENGPLFAPNNNNVIPSTLHASPSIAPAISSPTTSTNINANVNVPFRRTECPAVQLGRKIVLSSSNVENTYKLMFDIPSSLWKVDFIELHYKINEQPLKDIRLGNEVRGGVSVEQDGIVIRPHDNITYFATYAVDGAPCVTHTYIDTLEA